MGGHEELKLYFLWSKNGHPTQFPAVLYTNTQHGQTVVILFNTLTCVNQYPTQGLIESLESRVIFDEI